MRYPSLVRLQANTILAGAVYLVHVYMVFVSPAACVGVFSILQPARPLALQDEHTILQLRQLLAGSPG